MGGSACRWLPLVTPKELLPFGTRPDGSPLVAADCVIDAMAVADVERVIIPILPEKATVIMRYLGTRLKNGALIEYIAAPGPTLLSNIVACLPLVGSKNVFFGMPDTYFTPADILRRCGERLRDGRECVLGVFPSDNPEQVDLVFHNNGNADSVWPKPRAVLRQEGDGWGVAAWDSTFSERIAAWPNHFDPPGAIFQAVAEEGRGGCGVAVGQSYFDLGSYSNYTRALIELHLLVTDGPE